MHDNARPHIAQKVCRYLSALNLSTINWPARSPDLNPIEHIWDMLGRSLKKRSLAPVNLE